MKHTLVAWMRDKPGVLNQISGMLRRRNFNIDSLQVGQSETPGISRMTFVVDGDEHMADQVIKQLRKVIDVTRIDNLSDRPVIAREMALIRVKTTAETRGEIMQLVSIFRGEIVDSTLETMTVQIVGSEDRIDRLTYLLGNFGIDEMVRTGPMALARGLTGAEGQVPRKTAVWRASATGN